MVEFDKIFTDADHNHFLALPTKDEVKSVVYSSNLHAAPGTDGIPFLLYSKYWGIMGRPVREVVQALHREGVSKRT